jgi:Zn-dependent protease
MSLPWPVEGYRLLTYIKKPLLVRFLVFKNIRSWRLSAPKLTTVPREETPSAMAAGFASIEPELNAFGFTFSRAAIIVPAQGEAHKSYAWEYLSHETRVRVTVRNRRTKTGAIPTCFFKTNLPDGRMLVTSPCAVRADSTEELLENEIPDIPVREQYLAHLDFVQANAAGKPPLLLDTKAMDIESTRIWEKSMRSRIKRGHLFEVGEGRYAYTVIEALRRAFRASAKVARTHQSQHVQAAVRQIEASNPPPPTISEETTDYRQLTSYSHPTTIHSVEKLITLLLPMGFLVAAFHLSLSWETLLAFVAALTFHDCGQLLGMRIFGYKNLRIPCLPLLGALAGKARSDLVKPWQELLILFLGPFPGLAVGLLMLMNPAFLVVPLHRDLALMLVLFNSLNLLPIHPLDGGRIWDVLLFRRYPSARSLFAKLSGVSLLGLGLLGVIGPALFPIGLLILLRMSGQTRLSRAAYEAATKLRSSVSPRNDETLLPAVFELLQEQSLKLKGSLKIFFVRSVLEQCKTDPAGPPAFILGLVAYSLPILAGVLVLLGWNT